MREEWRVSDGKVHPVKVFHRGAEAYSVGTGWLTPKRSREVLCNNAPSRPPRQLYWAGRDIGFEYADFLTLFPWDNYSTITYRKPCHDAIHAAARAFHVLAKFDATRAFIAIEPHSFEGIHLHILSRHLPKLDTLKPMWSYCFKAFGRSECEAIDETLGVARYCSKYIVKGNQYEFMGDSSAWTLDS